MTDADLQLRSLRKYPTCFGRVAGALAAGEYFHPTAVLPTPVPEQDCPRLAAKPEHQSECEPLQVASAKAKNICEPLTFSCEARCCELPPS